MSDAPSPLLYGSATEWARARSASEEPRLGMLEAYALQRHPDVLPGIGFDGVTLAQTLERASAKGFKHSTAFLWLGMLTIFAFLAAPAAGFAMHAARMMDITRDRAFGPDVAVPASSVFFWITVGVTLFIIIAWIVKGARWSGATIGIAVYIAAMASFTWWHMTNATDEGFPVTTLQVLPVQLSLGLSVALAIAVLCRFTARTPLPEPEAPPAVSVNSIAPGEQAEILADRNAGLAALHEAGFIDEATLARANAAALGTLTQFDRPLD